MAKGRMISRLTGSDDKLALLKPPAALLYLLTIPHLDRDGLIDGRAAVLWGMVAPLWDSLRAPAHAIVQAWIDVELVTAYGELSRPILYFHGFRKHQEGMEYTKEAKSVFPPPPGFYRCPRHGLVALNSPDDHRQCKGRERHSSNLGYSHESRDQVETKSRPGRSEEEEKLLFVDDEYLRFSTRSSQKGGSGGKTDAGPANVGELFAMLDTDALWQLIDHLAEATEIASEHANWDGLCDGLDQRGQLELVQILGFLFVRADRITLKSPAAWVHASLRDHKPPNLRPPELVELARLAQKVLGIDRLDFFGL